MVVGRVGNQMNPTIVFRADASLDMGTGHVMRCLTLADALREKGAICHFICREHKGNFIANIRSKGFATHILPVSQEAHISDINCLAHSHWLGSSQIEDAQQCSVILKELNVKWVIVDHYALDENWECNLETYCKKLMVIDDLADRKHCCDLLLDQNWFGSSTGNRYEALTQEDTTLLLGPKYALLKPEYEHLRKKMPLRDGIIRRVLVFLGGSDPSNETEKVLEALLDFDFLYVDVVVGANHPDPVGIAEIVEAQNLTSFYMNIPHLADLMACADLMIGAGGSTTWERMCLGLPSIVISVADNQTPTNITLMDEGYINFIGEMADVSSNNIKKSISDALDSQSKLQRQSILMKQFVDGAGVKHVSDYLFNSRNQ
jgi:UDP-2,4-diacetamido-2,4,6-trideoxy-beta-L-altropyranose hydrolase